MPSRTPKRLSPEQRKADILEAARRLLARVGVHGFSLEAVAREAGVAASLPRHYFGGHVDLLQAATVDVLNAVKAAFLKPDPNLTLEARLSAYLDVLVEYPWGHLLWMRSAEIHPEADTIVRQARRRISEAMFLRPWNKLTKAEQIYARGQIGFVEAVVTDWFERGMADREMVIDTMARALRNLSSPEHRITKQSALQEKKKKR